MPTSPDDLPPPSIAAPVMVWSVIQIVPLWLSAAHVPLWARADAQVIENDSLTLMLAAQFGASAMLFPWLMQDLRSTLFVVLSAGVFVELAGMLGGAVWGAMGIALAHISIWLIGLALWHYAFDRPRGRLILVAIASLVVVGGTIVRYLAFEFGGPFTQSIGTVIWIGLMVHLIGALFCTLWFPSR